MVTPPNDDPRICTSAAVHSTATLGANVTIGEFAVIGAGAVIGDGCQIAAHAIVREGCQLGDEVCVDSFAVIGGAPQMRGRGIYNGTVRVGPRTVVREGVTIHRPTKENGVTEVGADCLLMANSHVGHDSLVEDGVTLANNVMLGGHVCVGRGAFLGGGAGVHQFVRIGRGAIVGGNASISYDIAPFVMAADRNEIRGLNLIGLRRSGCTPVELADVKRCYHAVFATGGDMRRRAADALGTGKLGVEQHGRVFLEFFASGKRGFAKTRTRGMRAHESEE